MSAYSSMIRNVSYFPHKSSELSSSRRTRNFISLLSKSSLVPFPGGSTGKRFFSNIICAKPGNSQLESYFTINGHGIASLSELFLDFGYIRQEELAFPAKKLKAFWFSPPSILHATDEGDGVNGPLPRVFISELLVDQMSQQTQEIIRKYTESSQNGRKHAALASALGSLTWEKPLHSEFVQLARESEYAAWTLVNGYAVNHVTISTHRLKSYLKSIKSLNQFIEGKGYKLNSEGGVLKVSPDGLLLQSSTLADSISFEFSDGITASVPCSYIEFAERLVLPQFKHLPESEVKEYHRRDGFEVGNADKIFESTSKQQLST